MTAEPAADKPTFERWIPALLLLVLGCLWGLAFSLSKIVAMGGVHPFAYSWYQSTGAAVFLTFVIWRMGIGFNFSRAHLLFYFGMGSVGLVIPNANLVYAAAHLQAGILSTVVITVPMVAYGISLVIGVERFGWKRGLGIGLGLVGVSFLILPESSLPSPDMVPWVLVSLLTPVCYAASSIFGGTKRPEGTHSMLAAWGMVTTASLISLPLMLGTESFYPLGTNWDVVDLALAGQMAISSVAYVIYFEIIRRSGPVFVTMVSYVVNIFGLGWGWLIFGETHSWWVFGAIGCVFAGLALVNARR